MNDSVGIECLSWFQPYRIVRSPGLIWKISEENSRTTYTTRYQGIGSTILQKFRRQLTRTFAEEYYLHRL